MLYALGIEIIDLILFIMFMFMFIDKVKTIGFDIIYNAVSPAVYDDPKQLLNTNFKYFV